MGKRPSLTHQVEYIAQKHESFGESKYEFKKDQIAKQKAAGEIIIKVNTTDKLFSISSMKTFLQASNTFIKFVKSIDPSVKWLKDIKSTHFEKYKEHIQKLSPKTQVQYQTQLKKLDQYIKKDFKGDGFIKGKVVYPLGWKSIKTRTDRAKPYDEKSRNRLEMRLPNRKDIFEIASYSGLRISELHTLKVKDVDFQKNTIYVEKGKGNRERTIPLRPEIRDRLNDLINSKKSLEKVFHINMKTVQREISEVNKKNNYERRNFHSFRHEYALREYRERYEKYRRQGRSRSDAREIARKEVSALLGHGPKGNENAILIGKGNVKGRISVTYEYITGSEGREIEAEVESRL